MTHQEVVQFIKDGNTLTPPEGTPDPIAQLMKMCWHPQPSKRPSFNNIYKILKMILDEAYSGTLKSKSKFYSNYTNREAVKSSSK